VSSCQERWQRLAVCAGRELLIAQTTRQVLCRVHVGRRGGPADRTAKRLLAGTVLAGDVMTARARVRRLGAPHRAGTHTPLGGTPGPLGREVGQLGRRERGRHPAGLKAHLRHLHLLVGNLRSWGIALHLMDGAIALLAHGPSQLLGARGGPLVHALLLQAGPLLGRAAALLAIPLVAGGHLASERAVVLAR